VCAALGIAVSLSVVGCASSPDAATDGAPADGEVASTEAEVRGSCTNPRKYFVTYGEGSGTCEPIQGQRGRWVPEPLFPDAPADVSSSTCAYRWSGERSARPDGDALRTRVGYANAVAAACGSSSTPEVGLLQPIPALDVGTYVGSVGCDVCGVVRRGRVWVILPAERVVRNQFLVGLSDGTQRAFQIQAPGARAASFDLPPAPAGTRYTSGRVAIY
jgi:hypothetical protein